MGVFGKIKQAKYSEGGVFLADGVYRLRIDAIKFITRRGRPAPDAYTVELNILESSNPERPVGSLCTWMVTLDKEPAMGNIKQFMETVIPALKDPSITEEQFETAVEQSFHESNPLKGQIVRASANTIMTKANRPFTKVKFMPDATSQADMAKAHADAK